MLRYKSKLLGFVLLLGLEILVFIISANRSGLIPQALAFASLLIIVVRLLVIEKL